MTGDEDHFGRERESLLRHWEELVVFVHRVFVEELEARAWEFSDDEIQAFRDELKKRSLGIASSWQHEDGVAFQVFEARV